VEGNAGGETMLNFSLTEEISEVIFDSDILVFIVIFITFTYGSQEQHREIATVFRQ